MLELGRTAYTVPPEIPPTRSPPAAVVHNTEPSVRSSARVWSPYCRTAVPPDTNAGVCESANPTEVQTRLIDAALLVPIPDCGFRAVRAGSNLSLGHPQAANAMTAAVEAIAGRHHCLRNRCMVDLR